MLRLPPFSFQAPRSLKEAASILAAEGPNAKLVAGGTDLWPKMKRRQMTPTTVIGLSQITELAEITGDPEHGLAIGSGVTLQALAEHPLLRHHYPAVAEAAAVIATPQLRNAGTIGGNLCVDTRCTYYDQTYPWRQAINFCLKKDGDTCWVAPGSPKCLAVTSTDLAPVMLALRARLQLVGPEGERTIDAAALYNDDGTHYLAKRPDEIIKAIELPPAEEWRSTYLKLRRRPAFDFPVLGAAVALRQREGQIIDARIALGGVGSLPREAPDAAALLAGAAPSQELYEQVAKLAAKPAKAMDNADLMPLYRKRMVPVFVRRALEALAPAP